MEGKQIFDFYSITEGDSELHELVPLLPTATGSLSKTYKLLERMNKENLTLKAFYIGQGDTPEGELVGSIDDGVLHVIEND